MPRDGSGVYSKPANTTPSANDLLESAKYNTLMDDLATDANTDRPIVAGGTGASSAAGARANLGLGAAAIEDTVPVSKGGTGATTLGDGHVLLGSGTGAVTALDVTAKGSMLAGDGTTDPQALAVGTNDQVLTADSAQATGVKWATPSSGPSQATQAAIEAETNQDTYAPPDLLKHSPGMAKAWVAFNGTGTVAINGSYNVASITDNGTGTYTVNIDTDFSNANYGYSVSVNAHANVFRIALGSAAPAAGTFQVAVKNVSGTNTDEDSISFIGYGDQ